jgi:hypothetical protein
VALRLLRDVDGGAVRNNVDDGGYELSGIDHKQEMMLMMLMMVRMIAKYPLII